MIVKTAFFMRVGIRKRWIVHVVVLLLRLFLVGAVAGYSIVAWRAGTIVLFL